MRALMPRAYGSPRTFPALGLSGSDSPKWRKRTWQLLQKRDFCLAGLDERALPGYTGTAWKAWGRRRHLVENEQTRELFGWSAADTFRDAADRGDVHRRADVQHRAAAHRSKRQAPLGRNRRGRQRLGHGNSEAVRLLLLRPTLDHSHVRELACDLPEEGALSTVRLQQRHLTLRQSSCQRQPRRAATRAYVDDRALERTNHLEGREALVHVHSLRLGKVANRSQTRCGKKGVQPALEPMVSFAGGTSRFPQTPSTGPLRGQGATRPALSQRTG